MFLNIGLSAGASDATTPKTPEILNSLISLTSPPLPPAYAHYQGGTAELLSPDCSTPGDECGPGGGWGGDACPVGVESGNTGGTPHHNNNIINPQQQQYAQLYPSSSLLTPTSDGSSPPPQGGNTCNGGLSFSSSNNNNKGGPPSFPAMGVGTTTQQSFSPCSTAGTGAVAPSLPSPVSTVEATRSALIKEGLKLQITSKLKHTSAAAPTDLLLLAAGHAGAVIKTELTPEDEERRRRRRERNKVAATKCRNKKKEMTEILVSESETVEEMNIRLKGEVHRLNIEKDRLEKFLNDNRHRSICNYTRRSIPSVSKLTVSSPSQSSPSHATSMPAATSPAYGSPSSSSCCSSSSPCSFTSLLSPSDSKEFFSHLLPGNSSASSSCLAESGGGFGTVSVASTAGSLECIEPTIPLDTASTTKVISSKRKASRYHPYMPNGAHASMQPDESLNSNYACSLSPSSSQCVSSSQHYTQLMSSSDHIGEYCSTGIASSSSDANYSCIDSNTVTVDTKNNPFKYPLRHRSAPHQSSLTELAPIEATPVGSRSEYRGGKAATLSRYSPYSVQQDPRHQQDLGTVSVGSCVSSSTAAGVSSSMVYSNSCAAVSNPHHNPFFPPGTYSNL